MNIAEITGQKDMEKIFVCFNKQIFSYVFLKVGLRKEIAEDLCQEIFLKIWKHRKNYNSKKGVLKTWIYRIAQNSIIDYYRQKKEKFENYKIETVGKDLEEEVIRNEMQRLILDKLKLLSLKEQDLIILHYIQQIPITEIAEITGENYGNMKTKVNRAFHKLKDLCNE